MLTDWIETHAARTPDKAALRWQSADISYAELMRRIDRTAAVLARDLDVRHGDRIAILAYNGPHYLELLFAAARLGAVVVTLNWRLAPPEYGYILDHSGAKLIVRDVEFAAGIDSLGLSIKQIGTDFAAAGASASVPCDGR